MYNLLSIFSLFLSSYFLLRILKIDKKLESILVFFYIATAHIAIWGYILSHYNHLSNIRYWTLLGLITVGISFTIWKTRISNSNINLFFKSQDINWYKKIKNWVKTEVTTFDKILIFPLLFTTLFLGALNFIVIIFAAPHNWDSMTYHLARVAYYLQHNNLNYFHANYWAQVTHPKNSSLLLLYTYLIANKNENLTQLVQFTSYWVAIISIYAITRQIGYSKTQSIFAATISALLTEWLMESITTQNDMILTAYFGIMVYFLFRFQETKNQKYLGLTALGIGFSIGTKASAFLPLLSIFVIALYVIFQIQSNIRTSIYYLTLLAMYTLLAIAIVALPAGYIDNYRHFGNPIAPDNILAIHTFENQTPSYILKNGSKNLLRYGLDFFSLDGAPHYFKSVQKIQQWMRFLPIKIIHTLNIELENPEASRVPFKLNKLPKTHEDYSYWGILGFAIIWPMVLLALFRHTYPPNIKILSIATILFLITQSYAGPYDPWRGRYFIIATVFAAPIVGTILPVKNKFLRGYLFIIILLGCASALSAIILRPNREIISLDYPDREITSIFTMDRLQQLTRSRKVYYEPLAAFDALVPPNATVAVFLYGDSFEYPLFGEHLTRTIIPINPFDKGFQPIPSNADYLLYTQNNFPCPNNSDIHLGADWYIRRLTNNNRQCPYP